MPETLSELEAIRFIIGVAGMIVTWVYWGHAANRLQRLAGLVPKVSQRERMEHAQRVKRTRMLITVQSLLCLVHLGFAGNAAVNAFFPSSALTQLNVFTSNMLQVLVPLALIMISNMLNSQMQGADEMEAIVDGAGPNADGSHWSHLEGRFVPVPGKTAEDADGDEDSQSA